MYLGKISSSVRLFFFELKLQKKKCRKLIFIQISTIFSFFILYFNEYFSEISEFKNKHTNAST